MNFGVYLLTALALILVIEGLLYAFFTKHVRALMVIALAQPEEKLRGIGLVMAGAGFLLLALLQQSF